MQGAGALLAGAQGQAGVHLGLPRRAGGLGQALALGGVGLLVGGVLGGGEPRLELGEPGEVALARLLGVGHRLGDAVGLGPRRARLRAVVAELLGDRRQRGVGLVQLGQCDVDAALRVLPLGLEAGDVEAEPLARRPPPRRARRTPRRTPPGSRAGSAGAASRRTTKWAPNTSPSRVTAVTSGSAATSARAASRSSTTAVLNEQPAPARDAASSGHAHHVDGVRRVAGQGRATALSSARRAAAEQQPGATEVGGP